MLRGRTDRFRRSTVGQHGTEMFAATRASRSATFNTGVPIAAKRRHAGPRILAKRSRSFPVTSTQR
jgi:hypothetical protein